MVVWLATPRQFRSTSGSKPSLMACLRGWGRFPPGMSSKRWRIFRKKKKLPEKTDILNLKTSNCLGRCFEIFQKMARDQVLSRWFFWSTVTGTFLWKKIWEFWSSMLPNNLASNDHPSTHSTEPTNRFPQLLGHFSAFLNLDMNSSTKQREFNSHVATMATRSRQPQLCFCMRSFNPSEARSPLYVL